ELVHAELDFRYKHGEQPCVEEYLERFPCLRRSPEILAGLVQAEWRFRARQPGTTPTDYRARFPDLADALALLAGQEARSGTQARPRVGAGAAGPAPEPLPDLPGYRLTGVLGRGGMGVVFAATDLLLNRPVAIKMLRSGGPLPAEHHLRFRLEAEVAASLR